jgi:hypothetical protein
MAQLSKSTFGSTYSNPSGTFQTNTTRDITESDLQTFSDDIADSAMFLDDNFIDEDSFATDSATKAPSQQSVKAYVAAQIGTGPFTYYTGTSNTNSGGTATTIITIPRATNKTLGIECTMVARWVSGGGGSTGHSSYAVKLGCYYDVAGTGTLLGSVTTLSFQSSGAESAALNFSLSGTNLLVTATCSSGVVYNVTCVAKIKEI